MKLLIFLLLATSVNSGPDSTKPIYPKKNPTVALLLSTLPGGGQFYTENYIKGVVFGLTQAYFGGSTIYLHLKAKDAEHRKYEGWKWDYDWYCSQRYNFLWWDALVWGLTMADAYVSAHFYKFKEQNSIKLETGYRIQGTGYNMRVCLTKSF